MWVGEKACDGRLPRGSVTQMDTRRMCGVSQVRKWGQGTGLGRGATCVKAQKQESIALLDNWKKLFMVNSYTFSRFPFTCVPYLCGVVSS